MDTVATTTILTDERNRGLHSLSAAMSSVGWKVNSGFIHSISADYEVSAVAKTTDGEYLCLIVADVPYDTMSEQVIMTPVRVARKGDANKYMITSIYGNPSIGNNVRDAIANFNHSVADAMIEDTEYPCAQIERWAARMGDAYTCDFVSAAYTK
jgi:hypothetical protein